MGVESNSIVLFGSLSQFTHITLKCLIRQNLPLRAIVLAAYSPSDDHPSAEKSSIFYTRSHPIVELANSNDLPICYFVGDNAQLITFLHLHAASIFLLSCYPKKLPQSITQLPARCMNIHPSKLPKFRGADPIFWQLRSGETETGVTLHEVTDSIDAGAILWFTPVTYPAGARLKTIQLILLKEAIAGLEQLLTAPLEDWRAQPQNHSNASWHPAPCREDYTINCELNAQLAFNFICAYSESSFPIAIDDGNTTYRVKDAIHIIPIDDPLGSINASESISVQFVDGTVIFLLNDKV
ncbi:MAG: hypothetical protein F4Z97_03440 [Gammaproteobacteria bacterium]|nr:hypothetical protein [Gammaproteobacteria bacterium]